MHPASLLLVDDDANYCEYLALCLEPYGLRVLVAHSGATALELSEEADVALIDMLMPGLSGVETIPLVHSLNPQLKVIASSGSDEALFREDLDRLGVERFLAKPFSIESLLSEIDRALG